MAKRRASSAPRAQIIRMPAPRAPIIQVRAPRAPSKPKAKRHRRRAGGARSGRSLMSGAIGGAVFGFIEKQFPNFPTLPFVGRAGTVALAGHFLGGKVPGGHSGIVADVTYAAAVIAGYELGSQGKINGVPSQVSGIASQT